jgi:hypothetical protein
MLRHVVMFEWRDGVSETEKTAVEEGLGRLPGLIPEIRRYEFGRDADLAEGNFDFVVVADFDSRADYETYQAQPDHLRVVGEAIRPAISARAGAQYWISCPDERNEA